MNVTAIVPSLNPDEKFLRVVQGLVESGFESIILVDDGSKPECKVWFERAMEYPQCTLLVHEVNKGKGRALKTAFEHFLSLNNGHAGVVTLDGDGQHAMTDVVNCAKALEENPKDLILGVRVFTGENVPARSRMGNHITSFVFKMLCGIPVTDTQTGLRGISADFCRYLLDVKGERFEFETNMLLVTRRADVSIREVPIETVYIEENKSSHFRVFRDSFSIYGLILKFILPSFLKYVVTALLSFGLDEALIFLFCWLFAFGITDDVLASSLAAILARILSSLFNFAANRTVVFRSKDGMGKTMAKYYALWVVQLASSIGLSFLFSSWVGCPFEVATLPVNLFLALVSFFVQRGWVFKK